MNNLHSAQQSDQRNTFASRYSATIIGVLAFLLMVAATVYSAMMK